MKKEACYGIIDAHVQSEKPWRDETDKYVSWYLSEFYESKRTTIPIAADDDTDRDISLETNYPYAFIDTMIANICPLNPMVTVNANKKTLATQARSRQALINDALRRDKMHAQAWDLGTFTAISGRGVSKTSWDMRQRRPRTRVIDPKRFFYDKTVPFEEARYACEVTLVEEDEFRLRCKKGKKGGPAYRKDIAGRVQFSTRPEWLALAEEGSSPTEAMRWCVVYEFYDFVGNRYYHFLDGQKEPLLEGDLPYKYVRNPFSLITYNRNLRDYGGVSDVKLIAPMQEQLNEVDSLELLHAFTSIPIGIVNEMAVDNVEDFIDSLRNAVGPGALARAALVSGQRLEDALTYTKTPSVSPSFATMRARLVQNIEFILGLPQYQRGQGTGSDLATELALIDTATRTRNGRRVKVMEDWIGECAKKYIGLWREFIEVDDILHIRTPASNETFDLDIDALGFGKMSEEEAEQEWWYDYEAIPYSPTENHRMVQLQKLQQFAELMFNNPHIDQGKLISKFLELMGMDDIKAEQQGPIAQAAPQGVRPGGATNVQLPSGTSADRLATGGPMPGAEQEAILPPGTRSLAAQPKPTIGGLPA